MKKHLSWSIKDNGYENSPLSPMSDKKEYTYKFKFPDLLLIGNEQRELVIDQLVFEFRLALQSTLYGGCWGNGDLNEMIKWNKKEFKKKKLEDLSSDDFKYLKQSGMLWEIYPDAPENWDDILKKEEVPDLTTMNIYSEHGTKVTVTKQTAKNGYESDSEYVKKYLEIGKVYTVDCTDVGNSETAVYLIEFPNIPFNSVNLIEINEK